MQTRAFEALVRERDGVPIIDLHGQIDAAAEHALAAAYAAAASPGPAAILLNFSAVHYINSTGIALIVGLLAQARKSRIRLLTFGLSEHYAEIFQITRLVDFMGVFPDESQAFEHLASS